MAGTFDSTVAIRFTSCRSGLGEEYRGRQPNDPLFVTSDLTYALEGDHRYGPLFLAPDMDYKWNIYLFDGQLFFTRSWTGGPIYALRVVGYLVKSHLYRLLAPHPFPDDPVNEDPARLAIGSRVVYGRAAVYGTFDDTTRFRVEREEGRGYALRLNA